jgi:AcrR family transcriptional regulator
MNYGKQENHRVKLQVIDAFFALLAEKPASDIRPSDIIKRSGVARTTYYRNFFNQEDIVECYLSELRENTIPEADNALSYENTLQGFTATLAAVKPEKDRFLLLYRGGFSQVLQAFLLDSIFDVAGDMSLDDPAIYRLYFVNGAMYNLLIAWFERDTKESPKELASIAANYLRNGALNTNES